MGCKRLAEAAEAADWLKLASWCTQRKVTNGMHKQNWPLSARVLNFVGIFVYYLKSLCFQVVVSVSVGDFLFYFDIPQFTSLLFFNMCSKSLDFYFCFLGFLNGCFFHH